MLELHVLCLHFSSFYPICQQKSVLCAVYLIVAYWHCSTSSISSWETFYVCIRGGIIFHLETNTAQCSKYRFSFTIMLFSKLRRKERACKEQPFSTQADVGLVVISRMWFGGFIQGLNVWLKVHVHSCMPFPLTYSLLTRFPKTTFHCQLVPDNEMGCIEYMCVCVFLFFFLMDEEYKPGLFRVCCEAVFNDAAAGSANFRSKVQLN